MWWSYILTVVGVTGLYFAGHGKPVTGWMINLSSQALWLSYALVTHQYGFLLGVVAYGWVFSTNLIQAMKKANVREL